MPAGHIPGSPRTQRSSGHASATMPSCPSSTPRLNVRRLGASSARGSSSARSAPANPNPWTSPKPKVRRQRCGDGGPHPLARDRRPERDEVLQSDRDDAQRDERLDEPRRRDEPAQRRQRQRHRVGDRERGDDAEELPERPPEEEHPEEEGDVVAPLEDVLGAEAEEPTSPGPRSRPGLDLEHRRARPGGALDRAARQPEQRDVGMPLGEALEEAEHQAQPDRRVRALPARAHRHPVLLGRSHRRRRQRARRAIRRHLDRAGDVLGPEHVQLEPRELEHRPHFLAVDGHVPGREAERVRVGPSRGERAEEDEGEESGRGHCADAHPSGLRALRARTISLESDHRRRP